MFIGNYIVSSDPDDIFKKLLKNTIDFGILKDQRFYFNSVTTRCYGNKRYITCLDYDISYPFAKLLEMFILLQNTLNRDFKIFDVLYEDFNGLSNITKVNISLDIFDFLTSYTYHSILLEIISCIMGLECGDIIFYNNLVSIESSNINFYNNVDNLELKFYKSHNILINDKEELFKVIGLLCDWYLELGKNKLFNPNITEIEDLGLRDLITLLIVSYKIKYEQYDLADQYTKYIDDNTFERMWCEDKLRKILNSV